MQNSRRSCHNGSRLIGGGGNPGSQFVGVTVLFHAGVLRPVRLQYHDIAQSRCYAAMILQYFTFKSS
jgi:hypothetical protein